MSIKKKTHKPPKRLFNCEWENESLNVAGKKLVKELEEAFKPILQKWIKRGYSYRDIMNLSTSPINVQCILAGLKRKTPI